MGSDDEPDVKHASPGIDLPEVEIVEPINRPEIERLHPFPYEEGILSEASSPEPEDSGPEPESEPSDASPEPEDEPDDEPEEEPIRDVMRAHQRE